MAIPDPIIEFRRVSKRFGAQVVLDGVDLQVERNKCTVIIGRSGTGKSVLLKHIVGLLRPDAGEVFYEGRRIDTLREKQFVPIRQEISFVFQLNALFDSMTVGENVAFPLREKPRKRLRKSEVQRIVRDRLALVGLAPAEEKLPAQLSGGEKKRVALARALAHEPPPKVVLYDEPTAGLDPQRADVINKLIRHLQTQSALTSIVVTHDMHSAAEVGDRILMLSDGHFIADGAPEEIMSSRDTRVQRFVKGMGEPEDLRLFAARRA